MDRRRYLRAVGAAAVGGAAGCPAINASEGPLLWEVQHPNPVGGLAVGDEAVFVATVPEAGRSTTLASLGVADGDERWTRDLSVSGTQLALRAQAGQLFIQNGRTLIVTPTGFTETSWRRQGATPPVIVEDTAYLRTVEGGETWTEAVTIPDGTTTWRVKLSDRDQIPDTQYPVAAAGDVIAVTDRRFPLLGLARTDGAIRWETDRPTGALVAATPTSFYVGMEGTRDATLESYTVATGDRTVILETGGVTLEPAIVDGFLRARITGDGVNAVVGIETATDSQVWRRDGLRGPAAWTTAETVYALDDRDRLVALERQDGTVRWRAELPAFQARPRLFIAAGTVVVATSHQIQVFDTQDGTTRWTREIDRGSEESGRYPVAVGSNTVVYATGSRVRGLRI